MQVLGLLFGCNQFFHGRWNAFGNRGFWTEPYSIQFNAELFFLVMFHVEQFFIEHPCEMSETMANLQR